MNGVANHEDLGTYETVLASFSYDTNALLDHVKSLASKEIGTEQVAASAALFSIGQNRLALALYRNWIRKSGTRSAYLDCHCLSSYNRPLDALRILDLQDIDLSPELMLVALSSVLSIGSSHLEHDRYASKYLSIASDILKRGDDPNEGIALAIQTLRSSDDFYAELSKRQDGRHFSYLSMKAVLKTLWLWRRPSEIGSWPEYALGRFPRGTELRQTALLLLVRDRGISVSNK